MSPQRIQRKRTKGWKMPEGAVYVGRPTKWGNPLDHREWTLTLSLNVFEDIVRGFWNPNHFDGFTDEAYAKAAANVKAWRARLNGHATEVIRRELKGADLACWCPLDQPCHADILLKIANGDVDE